MANKKKRLAQEITRLEQLKRFQLRLKKSKQQHKNPKHPLASAFDRAAVKITGHLPHQDFKLYFYQLSISDRKLFIEIVNHPKINFPRYPYFLVLIRAMAKLDRVIRPLATWKVPKSKDHQVILKSLYVHLFVTYRLPKVVARSIDQILLNRGLDDWQGRLLLGLTAGTGLHKINYKSFAFPINSKCNYHFYQAPTDYTIMQALAWAKLRSSKVGYVISNILTRKLFKDYYQQWPSWMPEVLGFLQRHPTVTPNEINQVLSFLIYQRLRKYQLAIPKVSYKIEVDALFPNFSLKGRTLASVNKYLEKWNQYITALKATGANGTLPVSSFKGFTYRMRNGRVYTFKQILTVKDLIMEGKRMNHCVGGYVTECMDRSSSIWSLQLRFPKGKVKKVLTIEILEKSATINQAHGMCNRNFSKEEEGAIQAWMAAEQLKLILE